MKTVTGILKDSRGNILSGVLVTLTSTSTPTMIGSTMVCNTQRTFRSDRNDGSFSITLQAGTYTVLIATTPLATQVGWNVPSGSGTVTQDEVTTTELAFIYVAPETVWNGTVTGHINFLPVDEPAGPSMSHVVNGGSSITTGALFDYAVSTVTPLGETEISDIVWGYSGLTGSANRISFTNTEVTATHIRIYRSSAGTSSPRYLLAEVGPSVTHYDDLETDAQFTTRIAADSLPLNPDFNSTAGGLLVNGTGKGYFSKTGIYFPTGLVVGSSSVGKIGMGGGTGITGVTTSYYTGFFLGVAGTGYLADAKISWGSTGDLSFSGVTHFGLFPNQLTTTQGGAISGGEGGVFYDVTLHALCVKTNSGVTVLGSGGGGSFVPLDGSTAMTGTLQATNISFLDTATISTASGKLLRLRGGTGSGNGAVKVYGLGGELDFSADGSFYLSDNILASIFEMYTQPGSPGHLTFHCVQVDYNGTNLSGAGTIAGTSLTASGLTAGRAVQTGTGGLLAVSATTATELGYLSGVTSAIQTQFSATEKTANKGAASGYCPLGSDSKVSTTYLPASVLGSLNYQGTWNATTNSPALSSGVGTKGFYYTVSTAGTTTIDGISDWGAKDFIVYNGTAWEKVDNTDAVLSVNGYTGNPILKGTDLLLTGFSSATGGTVVGTDTVTAGLGRIENRLASVETNYVKKDGSVGMTGDLQISVSSSTYGLEILNTSAGSAHSIKLKGDGSAVFGTGALIFTTAGLIQFSGTNTIKTQNEPVSGNTGDLTIQTGDSEFGTSGKLTIKSGSADGTLGVVTITQTNNGSIFAAEVTLQADGTFTLNDHIHGVNFYSDPDGFLNIQSVGMSLDNNGLLKSQSFQTIRNTAFLLDLGNPNPMDRQDGSGNWVSSTLSIFDQQDQDVACWITNSGTADVILVIAGSNAFDDGGGPVWRDAGVTVLFAPYDDRNDTIAIRRPGGTGDLSFNSVGSGDVLYFHQDTLNADFGGSVKFTASGVTPAASMGKSFGLDGLSGTPGSSSEVNLFANNIDSNFLTVGGDGVDVEAVLMITNSTSTKKVKCYLTYEDSMTGSTLITMLDTGAMTTVAAATLYVKIKFQKMTDGTLSWCVVARGEGLSATTFVKSGTLPNFTYDNNATIFISGQAGGTGIVANDILLTITEQTQRQNIF